MIKSLDTEISQDALMLVLDAIYMNGKWESPFDPDYTETDTFYNEDGSETDVEMMYQNIEEAEYAETENIRSFVCLIGIMHITWSWCCQRGNRH